MPIRMQREIHYNDHIKTEKDSDWDIIKEPVILKKKTITSPPRNKLLDYFPELVSRKKKKVALVLSGGGAKGLAHIGVIRELQKYNVDVDFIAGTSMGAIVGALYALDGNLELINKYIDINTKKLFSLSDFSLSLKGFIKGKAVENIFLDLYGNSTFKDTKIKLAVNAVDIHTGKEVVFKKGKIIDAVRASMSLPIIFSPKEINGKLYVDGGVANNVPCDLVPDKYQKIIVSNTNSKLPEIDRTASGIRYFLHFISILESNATRIPNNKKIIRIEPDMKDIFVGDFRKIKTAIERGQKTSQEVLPKYFKKIVND